MIQSVTWAERSRVKHKLVRQLNWIKAIKLTLKGDDLIRLMGHMCHYSPS